VSRDTIVFSTCSFLLGLTIGSLLIGPHLKSGGGQPPPPPAVQTTSNPMTTVREQIAQLNAAIERDPRNFEALAQLGSMYMDAAKFPQAIGYFERALAVRDDPALRNDLAVCYYNQALTLARMKRFDEARALMPKLEALKPGDADVQKLAAALNGNP
jgi:tetratricopeptide (TPR) repeat protein